MPILFKHEKRRTRSGKKLASFVVITMSGIS
ncbi:hypothetical protein L917_18452 [Phytophthora nicotianae]|uniref:Uncharacterized protein n=1 Tax=Phytophthora nicotianae TaxID=4792 RepID=W2K7M6_PHYNI|nr:hypothetical protein L917_18452 [Phytophthora nicotianae]